MSILAVILIHTSTKTLEATNLNVQELPWSLFLNQIFRYAVPLFFMISGFVLELNYHEEFTYGQYLKKRFSRIITPYIFWSLIYYYLVYRGNTENIFKALLTGNASYQLYFIPALLIFYLIFPLLHRIYESLNNKWVIILLGIIQMEILYVDYYVKPFTFFPSINNAMLNFFPFILGIMASHHEDKIMTVVNKWKYGLIAVAVATGEWVFYQGGTRYLNTGNYLDFFSQWRPSVLFYTIILAMVLFYFLSRVKTNFPIIKKLSKLSFFVFFVHVIIIEIGWKYVFNNLFQLRNQLWAERIWFDPIFFGVTAGFSFGIAWIAQKLPIIRKISA